MYQKFQFIRQTYFDQPYNEIPAGDYPGSQFKTWRKLVACSRYSLGTSMAFKIVAFHHLQISQPILISNLIDNIFIPLKDSIDNIIQRLRFFRIIK